MKKIVLFVIVAAFAVIAQATELWWFVAENVQVDGAAAPTWNTATVYASNSGNNFGGASIGSWSKEDLDFGGGVGFTELDSVYASSGYSFYIELLNSTERIATSSAVSYDDLLQQGAIASSMQSTPSVYQFSNFSTQVVPEPTSGLLMLIGLAGLALKRKRA